MTLNLNNIFDQFVPAHLGPISLTLLGSGFAIAWILLLNNTHWAKTRNKIPSLIINNIFTTLFPNTNSKWPQYLLPAFFICLSFNIMSLIPYTFSQTSHLSVTFSLSIPLWLALQLKGILSNWKSKLSHLVPEGTPAFLIPLMVLIELISLCIQPLTLGFRLGANLLAGHLLIFLCSCVVWESVNANPAGILSFIILLALFALEIAVALIQAAVFTILAKQYLEENA